MTPQQDPICAYLRICRFPSGTSAEQRAKLSRSLRENFVKRIKDK